MDIEFPSETDNELEILTPKLAQYKDCDMVEKPLFVAPTPK